MAAAQEAITNKINKNPVIAQSEATKQSAPKAKKRRRQTEDGEDCLY